MELLVITVITSALIAGIVIYFLEPKGSFKKKVIDLIINRTSFALLLSSLIIAFSYVYTTIRDPLAKSALLTFLDVLFGIPMAIPFIMGYFEGGFYLPFILFIETFLITLILRSLIPGRWAVKLKRKINDTTNSFDHLDS